MAQGIRSLHIIDGVLHIHTDGGFTGLGVEYTEGVVLNSSEIVIHSHLSTTQWHTVASSCLHTVVVVILGGSNAEVVLTHRQHRIAEGVGLRLRIINGHLHWCFTIVGHFCISRQTHIRQ